MRITIIGTGYVGLVTGTCLAHIGHSVIGVNRHPQKSSQLNQGKIPIYEPGLERILAGARRNGKIRFTTDLGQAVQSSDIVIIAVGTPSRRDGSADLQQVRQVAVQIGQALRKYAVIINKSTVPVGTARIVGALVKKHFRGKFDVVSCPEFLREGSAVRDFLRPDRIIIGSESSRATQAVLQVFRNIPGKKVITNIETAEMIKYASNAFLATKISFINEIANVCDRVGADVEQVALGMGLDPRIGQAFLRAGMGYGGSCFPKDVRALNTIAGTKGYNFRLLKSVIEVNNRQKNILLKKVKKNLKNIRGKKIAVLGLAFKGNTDDIRESAAIDIVRLLQSAGAQISVYDPAAMPNARAVLDGTVKYANNSYQAVVKTDAVIIASEWEQFKKLDWSRLRQSMRGNLIVDGKNLLNRSILERLGFRYVAMGK